MPLSKNNPEMATEEKLLSSELNSIQPHESSRKATFIQIFTAMMANLTILSPGMGMGFPAITSEILIRNHEINFTASQVSWFAAVTPLHCPFGGPLSSLLVTKVGRKGALLAINILSMIHWSIAGFSSHNPETLFVELLIARIITGFTIGMATPPSVMYSTEISNPKLKSFLAVLSAPFFLSCGSLLIYFLGYLTRDDFRLASKCALGIATTCFLICLMIPESPVYLVVNKKINKARKVLAYLRDTDKDSQKVQDEIDRIEEESQVSTGSSGLNVFVEFRKPEFYKPFLIMSTFFIIQQLSGIFLIFIFAAKFSLDAGVVMDEFLSAVIMGIIKVVMTFLVSFATNVYGRRQITIVSCSGMLMAMSGLVICQLMHLTHTWLPAIFLFSFCIFGVPGLFALPFAMVGDMYQQKSRSLGIGLNILICFVFAFLTIKTRASVFVMFGSTIMFSFYAFVSGIGILFAIFILPETKGKNQKDFENLFKKKN